MNALPESPAVPPVRHRHSNARSLPITLLCRRLDQLDPQLMLLWKRCLAEGFEPDLEWLQGLPYEEIRQVVREPERRLVVLCKTAGLDVRTRLSIKHGFIAHARPWHWLTTACLDEGHEQAWAAVFSAATRILHRDPPLPPSSHRDPPRHEARSTADGESDRWR